MDEWLSQYNVLYHKIKERFPDVQVGAPDVCGVHFNESVAGRSRWTDYTVPILNKVEGMDFFDYHYGVDPNAVQVILDTVNQYVEQKRGWKDLRSADSESGTLTFFQSPDPAIAFMNGLKNEQEWFGWLRNPDLSYGTASIGIRDYYDGFGRATGVGMTRLMFRNLRGTYVQSTVDSPSVETVAAIDEAAIYDGILTPKQVSALYQQKHQ